MRRDPLGPFPLFPTDAAMPELPPLLLLVGSIVTLIAAGAGVIGLGLVLRMIGRAIWGCA